MDEQQPSGRRRNRDRRRRNKQYIRPERKNLTKCPLCDQIVRDVLSAIDYQDQPAHFDCIIKILQAEEELEANEKIIYLGGGSFGIVQYRSANNSKLFVRKRIQYEEKEKKIEWRRKESEHLRK